MPERRRQMSTLELVVLGAGPAYTDRRGSAGASYLLRHGDAALVLDLGQGAFPNLASELEPSTLTAVVLSHLHPDHFVDLVALRHYLRYEFDPPRRVAIVGPEGLADRLDALNGDPGFAAAALDVAAFPTGPFHVGPFEIEAVPVTHIPGLSFGLRVAAGGAGLVYSGDCGRADDLFPLVRPGDAVLSEASFGASPVPHGALHLNGFDAGRVAAQGGASRLLITHVQMGFDRGETLRAARSVFGGPVTIVVEGDRLAI